jgi:RimJ/RimL family protein N-acetyltransferase
MIKGKNIGLRAVEKEDLILLQNWRNIAHFRKHFREHKELSLLNQENWFQKVSVNPNDFMFIIVRLDDNKPLGACGLLYTNWIIRSADYSFYIGDEEAYIDKKGYAEEASHLLISYGFNQLNLNKIWMELYEFDQAKIEFFTNVFHFHKDGILRQNCFEGGIYHDSVVISLLKSEYTPKEF